MCPRTRTRRTYVVSLYDAEDSIVVRAVQRDERARLDDLDALPARIRQWEAVARQAAGPEPPPDLKAPAS